MPPRRIPTRANSLISAPYNLRRTCALCTIPDPSPITPAAANMPQKTRSSARSRSSNTSKRKPAGNASAPHGRSYSKAPTKQPAKRASQLPISPGPSTIKWVRFQVADDPDLGNIDIGNQDNEDEVQVIGDEAQVIEDDSDLLFPSMDDSLDLDLISDDICLPSRPLYYHDQGKATLRLSQSSERVPITKSTVKVAKRVLEQAREAGLLSSEPDNQDDYCVELNLCIFLNDVITVHKALPNSTRLIFDI